MQYIGPTIIIIYDVYNLGKLERPHCNRTLEVMMDKGNHSLLCHMAELFRLGNYCNLPR